MGKKAWKLGSGKYAYITPRGKRGIASSWKAARKKAGYKKKKSRSSSRKKSRSSNKGGKSMGMKLKLGATAGLAGTGLSVYEVLKGSPDPAKAFKWATTGIGDDGKINWGRVTSTWAPLAIGAGISLVAAKLGINRYLPKGINL